MVNNHAWICKIYCCCLNNEWLEKFKITFFIRQRTFLMVFMLLLSPALENLSFFVSFVLLTHKRSENLHRQNEVAKRFVQKTKTNFKYSLGLYNDSWLFVSKSHESLYTPGWLYSNMGIYNDSWLLYQKVRNRCIFHGDYIVIWEYTTIPDFPSLTDYFDRVMNHCIFQGD